MLSRSPSGPEPRVGDAYDLSQILTPDGPQLHAQGFHCLAVTGLSNGLRWTRPVFRSPLSGYRPGATSRWNSPDGWIGSIHSQAGRSSPHGTIGPNGTFSLQSLKSREGAAPGEYKVRIEASSELRAKRGKAAKKLPFPSKYGEYDGETGLTATIRSEPTQLEPFRLSDK